MTPQERGAHLVSLLAGMDPWHLTPELIKERKELQRHLEAWATAIVWECWDNLDGSFHAKDYLAPPWRSRVTRPAFRRYMREFFGDRVQVPEETRTHGPRDISVGMGWTATVIDALYDTCQELWDHTMRRVCSACGFQYGDHHSQTKRCLFEPTPFTFTEPATT